MTRSLTTHRFSWKDEGSTTETEVWFSVSVLREGMGGRGLSAISWFFLISLLAVCVCMRERGGGAKAVSEVGDAGQVR